MPVETEAKLKVDCLATVQERLRQLEAKLLGAQDQQDLYCDNEHGDMVREDKCLRIRIETEAHGSKTLITYKGPKQEADLKCRQEIEFPVPDIDQARALLKGLGYEQKLSVHKRRELWSYRQCLIGLDQVTDLGTFVEIEGPDTALIHEVQKDLKLDDITHCQKSYACLLAASQKLNTEN